MTGQVLLLTAAIEPSAEMSNNLRSAVDDRRRDYLDALRYYIGALPTDVTDILFCENTLADLTDFRALQDQAAAHEKKLHFISFKGEASPRLGKGVCEFEILDVANDWLMANVQPDTVVWKITGRLIVKNIANLVRSRPRDADIYVDMRSVPLIGEKLGGNDWAEMRVFSYKVGAYEMSLKGKGESCGYVSEKGLFTLLDGLLKKDTLKIQPRFLAQPRLRGICGGSNKNYESIEYQIKDFIRLTSRKIVPQLWL